MESYRETLTNPKGLPKELIDRMINRMVTFKEPKGNPAQPQVNPTETLEPLWL